MKKSINTIFSAVAVALVLLTGCAQTQVSAPQEVKKELRSLARIESLGGGFQVPGGVSAAQSRVVFYRAAQNALTGATSIFLDGRYHASLEPGAWSALCYKTGLVEMGARQMLVGSQPKDLPDTITAMSLMPGQTHYVRVQQSADKPVLQPVAAAQAAVFSSAGTGVGGGVMPLAWQAHRPATSAYAPGASSASTPTAACSRDARRAPDSPPGCGTDAPAARAWPSEQKIRSSVLL
jgi:hypothetical protein